MRINIEEEKRQRSINGKVCTGENKEAKAKN
jgi:hypothetical protein